MQGTAYSFLDLTVMPFARKRVISANATLLFDADFSKVLWANAAGTELLASGHVIDLLDTKLSAKHPLISQIKIAANQVHDDNEIVRNFRIAQGLRSITLQGAVKKQTLPDGSPVFLVVFEVIDESDRRKEHVLAAAAVNSLDGFADASAIVDEFGLPIASSDDFDSMDVLPSVIAQLVQDTASESDRMVKRGIQSETGQMLAAGIGRIHDIPSRYIVVLAEFEEEEIEAENVSSDIQVNTFSEPPAPPWELENPNDVAEGFVEEALRDGEAKQANTDNDNEPSLLDRWYFKDEEEKAEAERAIPPLPNESSPTPTLENDGSDDEQEQPVRFAFTIGSDLIFNSVSPELQQTVGPMSGDIVGASWPDISAQYGFDETGSIKQLLEKADTWSGKSVLWPVEDTDMVMPIDLAALPVFTKDRLFDGFRGFGIIRTADAIVDVEARGTRIEALRASNRQAEQSKPDTKSADSWDDIEVPKSVEENLDTHDEASSHTVGWTTELSEDQGKEEAGTSNIVSIDGRSFSGKEANDDGQNDGGEDDGLTKRETAAFNNIREHLKNEAPASVSNANISDGRGMLAQFDAPILVYNENETLFANAELLELSGYASLEELAKFGGVSSLLDDFESNHGDIDCLRLKRKDGTSIVVYPILKRVVWEGTTALCLTFKTADHHADSKPEEQRATNLPVEERNALDMVRVSDLENILDTAADGILVLNNDGTIDALNSSGEALFAKNQADVAGKHFTSLFAKESQKTLNAYLDNLNDPNVSSILNDGREVIGIEANGGLIPMFASIGSIGESGRFCVVLRDLTERKKAEEELVTAKRSAETASEQKSEFLARMSHEIREPLNAIIGFSDIMIEERFGPIQNERYKEYLKDVNRSGIHVLDMVNDLLDISKIEAGKLELSYEAVDLNQLAAETVALLQPQANNQRIIIRTSLSRAVPKVVADARSIRQIILNLASNAIRHSPPNSQVIVSTTFEANGEVGLRVRDTGEGMDKEQLATALEPFSQVKSADMNKRGSTGLGLPLTKALIEANRAYFELESTPGEGTIAFVQFPSQRVLAD